MNDDVHAIKRTCSIIDRTSSIIEWQPRYLLAIRSLKHVMYNGEHRYLVRFASRLIKWTNSVGPCLSKDV